MPIDNCFRHQRYEATPTSDRFRLLNPEPPNSPDEPEFGVQLADAGELLRAAGVRKVYLVHGTLAGPDSLGLYREISRVVPALGSSLGKWSKKFIDHMAKDMGNYTAEFEVAFERGLNQAGGEFIRVERFFWSSENHHFGRAAAALKLLCRLASDDVDGRIMLWGHSHGGNVFAILTNLLGGDRRQRERFLRCFGNHLEVRDENLWDDSRRLLALDQSLVAQPVDIVTFGTPVRYGWETRGYQSLLHFVNHRPVSESPHAAPFPPTVGQLLNCEAGDYFQQIFIGGTDFPRLAAGSIQGHRFHDLLESELAGTKLTESLGHGVRVAEEGLTLLVDYNSVDDEARTLAGHAVYTRLKWLPFHAMQVARQLYGSSGQTKS